MPALCGKPAALLTPFNAYPCVLDEGHKGECCPGGCCVAHGPYIGQPNVCPQCPRWPLCAYPPKLCGECGARTVYLMDRRWGKELWKCTTCNHSTTKEETMSTNQQGEGVAQREMPRYKSHKQVWALKIRAIDGNVIVPEDEGYANFTVTDDYLIRHDPQPGGYYVVYAGGYKSWSPASAFEEGYTALNGFNAAQQAEIGRQMDAGCFARAQARGEQTFTLVAQDRSSPRTICFWIMENIESTPAEKLLDALKDALAMRSHPNRKAAD